MRLQSLNLLWALVSHRSITSPEVLVRYSCCGKHSNTATPRRHVWRARTPGEEAEMTSKHVPSWTSWSNCMYCWGSGDKWNKSLFIIWVEFKSMEAGNLTMVKFLCDRRQHMMLWKRLWFPDHQHWLFQRTRGSACQRQWSQTSTPASLNPSSPPLSPSENVIGFSPPSL